MTRPCSRYSRALRLLRCWSSSASSLPRVIRMTGQTDLHNKYRVNYESKPSKGGCAGLFSTRRTWRTLRAVAAVHRKAAEGEHVYLITHTMSDAADDHLRRRQFRKVLDRVRKLPEYAGHLWTTERHKRGQLHHHMVLRTYKRWEYRKVIQSWSMRYCGSVNGLDVATPPGIGEGRAVAYAVKAFGYACKDAYERDDKLPFRWWGTSRIARSFRASDDELPFVFTMASRNTWPKCAMVPREYAVRRCAQMTERYEWFRRCERVHWSRRSIPPPQDDEQLRVLISHRADDRAGNR